MTHRFDVDAALERIRAARAEGEPESDEPEPEPETVDQISKRIFEGDDLPDIADRMFRY